MRKMVVFFACIALLWGCNSKVEQADLDKLNGYWEIKKVVFKDGSEKEYGGNMTYDFLYIDAKNNGFRKKVVPQFDGKFLVNDFAENFTLAFEDEKAMMNYATPYAKWKEELRSVTDSALVIVNAEKEFYYKRTGPMMLDVKTTDDGKKAQ